MKKVNCIIFLSLLLSFHALGQSGNVGIGISSPVTSLHVKKATSELFQLENSLPLNIGGRADLKFKQGNYFTGVISTIGTGIQTSRMGFFTGAHTISGFLPERMSIDNSGNVGINNNNPNAKLDVIGTSEFTSTNGVEYAIKVNGPAVFNSLPVDPTALEVNGNLEVNGRIKMQGANPRAFVVTSTGATTIPIDHPDCNNNPNAIILVTARVQNSGSYPGSYYVGYDGINGKWSIYPDGYMIWATLNQVSLKKCNDHCTDYINVPDVGPATIFNGRKFNVLVIGN